MIAFEIYSSIFATLLHLNYQYMKNSSMGLPLDFIGFGASLLCALHCAALPFFLSLIPLSGLQYLDNAWIEYTIIFASFSIASYSLIQGYLRHHQKLALLLVTAGFALIGTGHFLGHEWNEALLTASGALIVAVAHLLNWSYTRQMN